MLMKKDIRKINLEDIGYSGFFDNNRIEKAQGTKPSPLPALLRNIRSCIL